MASKLIRLATHEGKSQQELSLRQAFGDLEPKLRPPFPLTIPNPQEYTQLNRAILYGVLCEPPCAKTHIKHLHAIVTDGYGFFLSLIVNIVNELYAKLVDSAKSQLLWVTREMIDVSAAGVDGLLVCLLRQIVGGDFSDENLWLSFELVNVFLSKWDSLLEEEPSVLVSALYTFLRLLADHCRLLSNAKLEGIKRLEIEFCVKMLREQFHLSLKIGRDLIRLLQDLVHVPEFKAVWKDLVLNPGEFRTPGFSDILQIYQSRTSSRYSLLRITPEMETQLRFLLTHVKFGRQQRYEAWFAKKFLSRPDRETLVVDIVRFICCAHHPPNEILQSDVIPRWAVVGWLLKLCRKNYIGAKVKLALFYDWLFFDERVDNIMNIEPAVLLMVCSIPKYIDMTHTLLEFLFLLVDNYDVDHTNIIVRGVASAFSILVRKGVVPSLDILMSCPELSPFLRERLEKLLSCSKMGVSNDLHTAQLPGLSVPPSSFPDVPCLVKEKPSIVRHHSACTGQDGYKTRLAEVPLPISDDSLASCSPSVVTSDTQVDYVESLVQSLGKTVEQSRSRSMALKTLETILLSFLHLNDKRQTSGLICPEVVSSKIAEECRTTGYRLFAPLRFSADASDGDDEVESATALIIRTFILSQQERMQEMLLHWSHNGFLVGARLLSYAARLAYEAHVTGYLGNEMADSSFAKVSNSDMPALKFHFDGYFSYLNGRKESLSEAITSLAEMDKNSVAKLVESAFSAYKCFLTYSRTVHREAGTSLSKLLFVDLMTCCEWERKRVKFLFCSIFFYLPDLSVGDEDIMRLLVHQLDHADLLDIHFEIGLKKFCVFGENTDLIFHLIKKSLNWNYLEQHKFWGLIRSELAVSSVELQKIILDFFCTAELDANLNSIAVGGLLTVCSCRAPTLELVGAIMLLTNDAFKDFAPAVLSVWVMSNASMLFDSFAKFLEKLENNNPDSVSSDSSGIMINHAAILWLLNYFNSKGMDVSDILSKFSIPG